jgi:hypothetical protein
MVHVNQKIGYVDLSGKLVIPPAYHQANDFVDGTAIVEGRQGAEVIDRSGKRIGKDQLLFAGRTLDGKLLVRTRQELWGLMSPGGSYEVAPAWKFGASAFGYYVFGNDEQSRGKQDKVGRLMGPGLDRTLTKSDIESFDPKTPATQQLLSALARSLTLSINHKIALRISKLDLGKPSPTGTFYLQSASGKRTREFSF